MGKLGRARERFCGRGRAKRRKFCAGGKVKRGGGAAGASRVVEKIEGGEVHRRGVLLPHGRAFCSNVRRGRADASVSARASRKSRALALAKRGKTVAGNVEGAGYFAWAVKIQRRGPAQRDFPRLRFFRQGLRMSATSCSQSRLANESPEKLLENDFHSC